MSGSRLCVVLGCLVVTLGAAVVRGTEPIPEELLKSKGLSRVGSSYLLDGDVNIPGSLRLVRATKKKVEDSIQRRANLRHDIEAAKNTVDNLAAENDRLTDQLHHISKDADVTYNQMVDRVNAVRDKIREGLDFVDKRQRTLASIEDPSDEYVAVVLKYCDDMEAVAHRYQALADDEQVKAALGHLNGLSGATTVPTAPALQFQLGPSQRFKQELEDARKLRKTVNSADLKVDTSARVPMLEVTLNGNVKVWMVIDSGAAMVTINSETADKLGLHPGPKDRTTKLIVADGKEVTARVMKLQSVRLGDFSLQEMECAVMPPEAKNAGNLLGDAFLQHFVYRMDLAAGILHISEVNVEPKAAPVPQIVGPATSPENGPLAGTYWIVNAHSGQRLTVKGAELVEGEGLMQAPPGGGAAQAWEFKRQEDGSYAIFSAGTKLALSVANHNQGEVVAARTFKPEPEYQWMLDSVKSGTVRIWNAGSHRSMDVAEESLRQGMRVLQWFDPPQAGQIWKLQPVKQGQ